MADLALNTSALLNTDNINTYIEFANNAGPGVINPTTFYSKQLLDTIRLDADQYVYYRMADTSPIGDKADKLQVRRWAPLQAHTVPLTEGIPPASDKGSVEKYEFDAFQYGRYMEFSDKVDFAVVDPVVAHYTQEYTIVAMETLDLLAREELLSSAQKYYADQALAFENLTLDNGKPQMEDFRKIVMSMKKQLVKPRNNGRFHVIGSAEFFYDMLNDDIVQAYMSVNQSTYTMFDKPALVPMFEMEFYETMCVPTSGEFIGEFDDGDGGTELLPALRIYAEKEDGTIVYRSISTATEDTGGDTIFKTESGHVLDPRTGHAASYIPDREYWDLDAYNDDVALPVEGEGEAAETLIWKEFKAQHILVLGKDALLRTGLQGEDNAKVYVKPKGSTGVLDPIDQRQSIGFKINSVGFGTVRNDAIYDYICVPSQVNA